MALSKPLPFSGFQFSALFNVSKGTLSKRQEYSLQSHMFYIKGTTSSLAQNPILIYMLRDPMQVTNLSEFQFPCKMGGGIE